MCNHIRCSFSGLGFCLIDDVVKIPTCETKDCKNKAIGSHETEISKNIFFRKWCCSACNSGLGFLPFNMQARIELKNELLDDEIRLQLEKKNGS